MFNIKHIGLPLGNLAIAETVSTVTLPSMCIQKTLPSVTVKPPVLVSCCRATERDDTAGSLCYSHHYLYDPYWWWDFSPLDMLNTIHRPVQRADLAFNSDVRTTTASEPRCLTVHCFSQPAPTPYANLFIISAVFTYGACENATSSPSVNLFVKPRDVQLARSLCTDASVV